jgi:ATP-binding cassette subfamily F protein 3
LEKIQQPKINSTHNHEEDNNKLSWKGQKQKESQIRKLEKQIKEQENIIQKIELSIEQLNEKLSDTEHYQQEISSGALYQQYQNNQKDLEQAMKVWEILSTQLESLQRDK